ncbi:MAG: hypothetical protein ABW124_20000, partial [Candidatus Thiodiazotropha sp. 6PLUC9]
GGAWPHPTRGLGLILFYEGVVKASCENSQIGFERITVAWMKRSGIRGKVQVILGLLQSGLVVWMTLYGFWWGMAPPYQRVRFA